jgi:Tol biopolymer transport system component
MDPYKILTKFLHAHDKPEIQKAYLRNETHPRRQTMRKRSTWFGMTGILVLAVLLGAFSQSGEDLFQKALRLERNEGKLMEAIQLYNKVVAAEGNETLAAQAQLRIGLCFEKMGKKSIQQAQEAFQKVIDNFPGQMDVVKVAKEKLSLLLKPQTAAEKTDHGFKMNPIWSEQDMKKLPGEGAGIGDPRPSPDGQYTAFIDWNSDVGELFIYQAAAGKVKNLTQHRAPEERTAHVIDSRWSRDGLRLAYYWENDEENYVDLRVIGLKDTKPRTLYRGSYAEGWMSPLDWSPDGKNILALMHEDIIQFVLVPLDGGDHHIIKTFTDLGPGSNPSSGLFSPDGRYIAYNSRPDKESSSHDVFLFDLDSGQETAVAPHPSHDYLLDWAPDGGSLVFASDRAGTVDCWTIPVHNGKATGKPSLAIRNIGYIKPLGMTREGTLYFDRSPGSVINIYTAAFDPQSGQAESPPEILPLPFEGRNVFPDWSPDGSTLAYISMRMPPGRRVLCLYSPDSGRIREMPFRHMLSDPKWSSDGRFLFAMARDASKIYRIDRETTIIQTLVEGDVYSPSISPDMNFLYYGSQDEKTNEYFLMRRELKTGRDQEIYRNPWVMSDLELSPDGRRVAVMLSEKPYGPVPSGTKNKNILGVIPSSGGEIHTIHEFIHPAGSGLVAIDWSPDGRYIVFSKLKQKESMAAGAVFRPWQLWRVPADGGQAEYLGLECRRFRSLSVHPDGHRVAFFSHGTEGPQPPSFWLVENFLPKK